MNVLIDRENMMFLFKMEHHSTLSKLASMEWPHVHTKSIYCDHPNDFAAFTDLELKLLIKNSNGPNVTNVFAREALLKIIHSMVQHMPEREANAYEVNIQHRTIPSDDKRRFKYVPGSYVPLPVQDGLEEYAAWTYTAGAVKSPASAGKGSAVATPAPSAVSALPGPVHVLEGDGFSMPKTGSSTHTIFMFCAQRWKEASYTEDKNSLNNIRKKAVEMLVPQGLNISTVRTQATRWYQHRKQLVV